MISKQLRKNVIEAGYKAVEQLIKVAKDKYIRSIYEIYGFYNFRTTAQIYLRRTGQV